MITLTIGPAGKGEGSTVSGRRWVSKIGRAGGGTAGEGGGRGARSLGLVSG